MTITLLLLLSAGLLVMAYLLWTLHSRLRLLERMDATRKRDARDLSKMLGKVNDFTLKLAEKVLTKDEYQAPTAKPVELERVPRPFRTKPVMNPQPTTDK